MSVKEEAYILEAVSQERERVATNNLLKNELLWTFVASSFGLGKRSWFLVEFDTQWAKKKPGDVDILGGRLGPDNDWPPPTDFLVGFEVKCGYFDNGKARSTKNYPDEVESLRAQVEGLLQLGLDHAVLIDLVATKKASGPSAWTEAAENAFRSELAFHDILGSRLPAESPAGHIALLMGAVEGRDESTPGDESVRGVVALRSLQPSHGNSYLGNEKDVRTKRTELRGRVTAALDRLGPGAGLPMIFFDCCGGPSRVEHQTRTRKRRLMPPRRRGRIPAKHPPMA